jgi:Flp pilus assembly protein TadG
MMRFVVASGAAYARDEKGSVLPLTAVLLSALIGMVALAVDLGMVYVAKSEAQRAADAAVLAGSTVLITEPGKTDLARRVAIATAGRNRIRKDTVRLLPEDVTVTDTSLVARAQRLSVRGDALRTSFAGVLGVRTIDVAAQARVGVFPAGSATCFKPFIVPDLWHDANGNGRYDAGELYDRGGTGYGTDFRKDGYIRDFGRPITLYPGTTGQSLVPSWYFLMRMPGNEGGSDIRTTIAATSCNPTVFTVGEERMVDQESGLKKGPVKQGVDDLIAQDPGAYWDATARTVKGSRFGEDAWRASPRVINVALFDPRQPVEPGTRPITITNFVTVFLERTSGDQIVGRFLPTVGISTGTDCRSTGTCAAFARFARLVQ